MRAVRVLSLLSQVVLSILFCKIYACSRGPVKTNFKCKVAVATRRTFPLVAFFAPLSSEAAQGIPVEVSSVDVVDKVVRVAATKTQLVPNTAIETLEGADNLGALLFTIVIYNGIFVTWGRPAEWMLPLLAKLFAQEDAVWYKDYKEGFDFTVPPLIEAARVTVFGILGWYTNQAWVAALGGDSFWGWSTAACLAIPATLFSASREALPTRQEADFQVKLTKDFENFAEKRLTRSQGAKCSEAAIITSFRRFFVDYRTEEQVSDKSIRRIVRRWVGYKTDLDGNYLRLSLTLKKKEAKMALEKNMKKAAELRAQAAREMQMGSLTEDVEKETAAAISDHINDTKNDDDDDDGTNTGTGNNANTSIANKKKTSAFDNNEFVRK